MIGDKENKKENKYKGAAGISGQVKKVHGKTVPPSSVVKTRQREKRKGAQMMGTQTFSNHLLKVRGCTWVVSLRFAWRTW